MWPARIDSVWMKWLKFNGKVSRGTGSFFNYWCLDRCTTIEGIRSRLYRVRSSQGAPCLDFSEIQSYCTSFAFRVNYLMVYYITSIFSTWSVQTRHDCRVFIRNNPGSLEVWSNRFDHPDFREYDVGYLPIHVAATKLGPVFAWSKWHYCSSLCLPRRQLRINQMVVE